MFQYACLVFLVFIFTNPVSTAVVDNTSYRCSVDEFRCGDGTCVGLNSLCDGIADCVDFSDEGACGGQGDAVLEWNRVKRQASLCRKNQWQCRDGSCIGVDGKCDGAVDCPDGSDETFPLCRKTQCQSNWFRCTYGACVDRTAPCNGVQDCADNSDELLPRCRNSTDKQRGMFKCKTGGTTISVVGLCDGAKDCEDGSDETLEACAGNICAGYLFQCAYGACVDQGSDCNGKEDCADGSDETDELCNRIGPGVKPVTRPTPTNKPVQGGNCKLPSYPQYGTYIVSNVPGALPGESYPNVLLNISCNPGFRVEEMRETIYCYEGVWSNEMPKCVRFCRLNKHPSVEYRCISTGAFTGSRECGPLEPAGTIVQPICRTPNYYYPGVLSNMNCIDGYWDYIALCKPGLNNPTSITITINNILEINISSNNLNNIVINNYAESDNVKITRANNNKYDNNIRITKNNENDKIIDANKNNDGVKVTTNNILDIVKFEDNQDLNVNIISKEKPKDINSATDIYNKYDIDEGDWRMGQAQVVRPNNGDNDKEITREIKYDIDEGDWRMGQAQVVRPNNDHNNNNEDDDKEITREITSTTKVDPVIYFKD